MWHGSEDDLSCNVGSVLLRVEQMSEDSWWWAVVDTEDDKLYDESFAPTKETAKNNAQNAFLNARCHDHILKKIDTVYIEKPKNQISQLACRCGDRKS